MPALFFVYDVCMSRQGDMMNAEIHLEAGVPLPPPRVEYKYPFGEMDVGDSFVVPLVAYRKVMNAKARASKRLGWRFQARTEGENLRVWRVS